MLRPKIPKSVRMTTLNGCPYYPTDSDLQLILCDKQQRKLRLLNTEDNLKKFTVCTARRTYLSVLARLAGFSRVCCECEWDAC